MLASIVSRHILALKFFPMYVWHFITADQVNHRNNISHVREKKVVCTRIQSMSPVISFWVKLPMWFTYYLPMEVAVLGKFFLALQKPDTD